MTTATLAGRDIYLRHTATDGKSYVQQHRVWDADKFMASQQKSAEKLNREVKDEAGQEPKPRLAKVEQITEKQYRDQRQR